MDGAVDVFFDGSAPACNSQVKVLVEDYFGGFFVWFLKVEEFDAFDSYFAEHLGDFCGVFGPRLSRAFGCRLEV